MDEISQKIRFSLYFYYNLSNMFTTRLECCIKKKKQNHPLINGELRFII